MFGNMKEYLQNKLQDIKKSGRYKDERIILTPQSATIRVKQGNVLNFCANNYLGLANNESLKNAAMKSLEEWGYGLSSVRFICGTQEIHKTLEGKISHFLGTEDTILYTSCFDANGGLFEALLNKEDAIISDQLNHASIIDGIRLCKAQRYRYKNADMEDLEKILKETQNCRFRMIATDGVFSMDGYIAPIDKICELAEKYDALVMVDDSHATGFIGKHGRGTHEYHNVMGRVDIITSTLGKAMGGASGGFTTGRKEIVEFLRQRSRPYLFSNTIAPVIVSAAIKVFDILEESTELRDKLEENTKYFRENMKKIGFRIKDGIHPIVPIMLYEAKLASDMADKLLAEGIYVIGFSYPVVPEGEARIRVQISAAHNKKDLDFALEKFGKVGREVGVLKD